MAIERKVEERWVCDNCGEVIENRADAVILETFVRTRGIHGMHRTVNVFCNKECANEWWSTFNTKKDKPLMA